MDETEERLAGGSFMARPDLRQNEYLDAAIENFHKEGSQGALQEALAALLAAMERGGGVIVPADTSH